MFEKFKAILFSIYESLVYYILILIYFKNIKICFICSSNLFKFKTFRFRLYFIRYKICKSCNHLTQSPLITNLNFYYNNIYRSFNSLKNYEIFEREKRRGNYIIDFLLRNNVSLNAKSVLELGCSSGGILQQFKIKHNCKVVGYEINTRSLNFGRKKGLDIVNNLDSKLLRNNFFDIVILSHSLEHLHFPEKDLKLFSTFLKKNGLFYIEVPGKDNPRVYENNYTAQPGHLNIFSNTSLIRLGNKINLEHINSNFKIQSIFKKIKD